MGLATLTGARIPHGLLNSLVTVMLRGEGTEGGTVFVDSSVYKNSVTGSSVVTSSSLGVVAGVRALNASGTGATKGALVADQSRNDFGTGPFTIEGWFTFNGTSGVPRDFFKLQQAVTLAYRLRIYSELFLTTRQFRYEIQNSTAGSSGTTSVNVPTSGTHHICVMRSGAFLGLFVDGVLVYTWATPLVLDATTLFRLDGPMYVLGPNGFDGACDEYRVTKKAMYNLSGFAVPVPPLSVFVGP